MADGRETLPVRAFEVEVLMLMRAEVETIEKRSTAILLKDVKIQPKDATKALVSKPVWPYQLWSSNYDDSEFASEKNRWELQDDITEKQPLQVSNLDQGNLVDQATRSSDGEICEADSTSDSTPNDQANSSPNLQSLTALNDLLSVLLKYSEMFAESDDGSASTELITADGDHEKIGATRKTSEATVAEYESSAEQLKTVSQDPDLRRTFPATIECESKVGIKTPEMEKRFTSVPDEQVNEDPTMQLKETIETTPHQKTAGIGDCKENPVQVKELEQNSFLDEAPNSGQEINSSKVPHFKSELESPVSTQSFLYNSIKSWLRNVTSDTYSKTDCIKQFVRNIMDVTVQELQANYFIFNRCYIIETGSMAEGTKIGQPDEFDFTIALPVLADLDVAELFYTQLGIQTKVHKHSFDKVLSFLYQFPFADSSYSRIRTNAYLLRVFRETLRKQLPIEWIMREESDIHMMRVFLKHQTLTLHLQCISGPCQGFLLSIDVCYGIPLDAERLKTVYVSDMPNAGALSFIQRECLRMNTEVVAIISCNPLVGQRFFFQTEPFRFHSNKLAADCYRLAKYLTRIFLPRISKNKCKLCEDTLIPSFYLKTVLSFMMDVYTKAGEWSDVQLGNRVIETFEIIRYSYMSYYRVLSYYSQINSMRMDVKMKFNPATGALKVGEGMEDEKPCTIPNMENVSLASSQVNIDTAMQSYWNYMESEEWTVGDLLTKFIELLYVLKFTKINISY